MISASSLRTHARGPCVQNAHVTALTIAIAFASVCSACGGSTSASRDANGATGNGGTGGAAIGAGGSEPATGGNPSDAAVGGRGATGGTKSQPGGSSSGVTLGQALEDPKVASAAADMEAKCKAVVKRVGGCSGTGIGTSKCLVVNWPTELTVSGTSAVVDCLAARTAEYTCSDGLDCAALVGWYNRDGLVACEAKRKAVLDTCPAGLRD